MATVDDLAADARRAPQAPGWYDTPTAARIATALRSLEAGAVGVIAAAPGIGKTKAAQRYASIVPHTHVVTASPASASVRGVIAEVAGALDLWSDGLDRPALTAAIGAKLAGRRSLLIVDDAHQLAAGAVDELVEWTRAFGCGVALLAIPGTAVAALLHLPAARSPIMDQARPLPGDLEALFEEWGIEDDQQRAFLTLVGDQPGALRSVTLTIEVAIRLVVDIDRPLSLDALHHAARLRGLQVFDL